MVIVAVIIIFREPNVSISTVFNIPKRKKKSRVISKSYLKFFLKKKKRKKKHDFQLHAIKPVSLF